jgi:hypothetical protein
MNSTLATAEHALSPHDRAALPKPGNRHCFYRADMPMLVETDRQLVAKAICEMVEDAGLGVAEIDVYNRGQLTAHSPEAGAAFERMCQQLGLTLETDYPILLVCEWATPHVDLSFAGSAFVSAVVHVGTYPYVMTMMTPARDADTGLQGLKTTTQVLRLGETYVFDPTVPHTAMPGRPAADSLLIILQAQVDFHDDAAREATLRRFPRHPEDKNQNLVFDLVLGSLE